MFSLALISVTMKKQSVTEFQTTVECVSSSTWCAIERKEINSTFPEKIRKQDFSTSRVSSTPLNYFNLTPKRNQPSIDLARIHDIKLHSTGVKSFHPDSPSYSRNSGHHKDPGEQGAAASSLCQLLTGAPNVNLRKISVRKTI